MKIFRMLTTYKSPWINCSKTYFTIVYTPRCGSNYLAELLDSSKEIICHTELFNPHSTYLSRQTQSTYIDKDTRDRDPWCFLRRLILDAHEANAFGFKIGLYDIRPIMLYVLMSRRVRKVVIHRQNLLAAYVSLKKASTSGRWIQWQSAKRESPGTRVHLNIRRFYAYALKTKAFYAFVRLIEILTLQSFHWIAYEDLEDPKSANAVTDFLGVGDLSGIDSKTVKQGKRPLRDQIENADEVFASITRFRFEWILGNYPN